MYGVYFFPVMNANIKQELDKIGLIAYIHGGHHMHHGLPKSRPTQNLVNVGHDEIGLTKNLDVAAMSNQASIHANPVYFMHPAVIDTIKSVTFPPKPYLYGSFSGQ